MHFLSKRPRLFLLAGVTSLLFVLSQAWAADFSVNPIRLELGPAARSGVFSVRNDGKEKLSFQIEAMEWTQDASGADQYTETRDLIFFPKILGVEAGEEGIIRVGAKNTMVPAEKTYRVFIQELPSPSQAAKVEGPRVNLLLRFGAPVFVAPAKPTDSADLAAMTLNKGVLSLSVKNTGNRHHVIQGIHLKGADRQGHDVYELTLADRYLLTGTTKTFTATIPPEKCDRLAALALEFKTDKLVLNRKLDVTRAMCS